MAALIKTGQVVKLTTQPHLIPKLRMRGNIPPLPHTSSWRGNYLSRGKNLLWPLG